MAENNNPAIVSDEIFKAVQIEKARRSNVAKGEDGSKWSNEAFAVYLITDAILVTLYCVIWIICFKKNSIFRALSLSSLTEIVLKIWHNDN